jgi:PAS domain S-box-containing protein
MRRSTYTLLIIEDTSSNRSLYQRYLLTDANSNWHWLEAESVAAGLELCRTRKIDAVLLGDSGANVDGLAFLKSLHSQGQGEPPPVVLVAAVGDLSIAINAMKLGAQDYLVLQDLTPERLQLTLQRAIERPHGRHALYNDRGPMPPQPPQLPNQLAEVSPNSANLEVAMLLSEEQLKVGIQVAGVALAQFNYASDRVTLSPEAAAMYGFPINELDISRDRIHETFHPDERAELLEMIAQVLNPEGLGWFARDHRVVWPTGEVRWLSVRKQVFFDRSGAVPRPSSAILAAIDITERKQTEAALQESERKFSAIFDQTFELLGLLSREGILEEVNQSALDSIAAQKVDIIGQKFWETPWWQHSQALQEQLKAAIVQAARGQFMRYEVLFPNGRGEPMVTDFSLKPVFDEAGQVVMIIAEGYDITERKRTEAALVESEARFRTLADNISQLAWMADSTGWIFWYNQRWFNYTGTTLAEMQGWRWQQVHHPEHVNRVVEQFRRAIAAGEIWEDTFPLRRHDGTYRWFLSRALPIRDPEGQIFRWFGTNTDVTELKQTQAALEDRNNELDSFAHIVSHDLKAPLRAISNLSQWIEDDLENSLSDTIQQHTTLLRSRVQRMTTMIDGLLDYARVGRAASPIEPVAVADLLQEVIDAVAPPPTFTITITPNLPTLYTKRLLLFQVFANLIGNGVKHHDRDDGSIEVSGHDQDDFYAFVIADDGKGIAPKYHDKIFSIFHAVNPENKQDSTGIGLAIVKKIVESEQGTIGLVSEVGKGTTFSFTWPKRSNMDA